MESEKLLEDLFDRKILIIIRFFLKNPDQKFYLREIAKSTRIPLATTFRILNNLLKLEIIERHKVKAFKFYSWNNNEQTKYLQYILEQKKTVLDSFTEKVSQIEGVEMIILHGEASKDQANILIVGKGIDTDAIRQLVVEVKEKNSFTITNLTLEPEQFNQMAAMGLYPKKKVVLYEKV
ncbi:hypothetical protein C4573_05885 [Candidatus Woesearchaeota archaeon]|nr:MAG: hypothetical protein C4573_05885 [Candidatus Woesearchaeota archaeon]